MGVGSGTRLSIRSDFDINICDGIRRLVEIKVMRRFMRTAPRHILVGRWNEGEWGGRFILHAWEGTEMNTGLLSNITKEKWTLGRPRHWWDDKVRIDLKTIRWEGVDSHRMAQGRDELGNFWARHWTFRFSITRRISSHCAVLHWATQLICVIICG